MFEDYTEEWLLEDILSHAPDGIDTRQGSIFYDAVAGVAGKIAKLYTDLDLVAEMTKLTQAGGDALDVKATEYGVTRLAATAARYRVTFTGTLPEAGERFYTDGRYFVLVYDDDVELYLLEAEEAGEDGNEVYAGTAAVPVNTIEGLESATFGEIYEHGSDSEDDDSLRARVEEKIATPTENGNRQQYKSWCESTDGVGVARIFPLWNGENTVKAVLIDSTGQPCSEAKIKEVQDFIDPADKGMTVEVGGRTYTVGDGLGNGVASIGAHFTACSADALVVDVAFTAELAGGATAEEAAEEAAEAIEGYFRNLVLEAEQAADVVVRISNVGALLTELRSILDYSNLTLNGGTVNIVPGDEAVPVVGEVVVD